MVTYYLSNGKIQSILEKNMLFVYFLWIYLFIFLLMRIQSLLSMHFFIQWSDFEYLYYLDLWEEKCFLTSHLFLVCLPDCIIWNLEFIGWVSSYTLILASYSRFQRKILCVSLFSPSYLCISGVHSTLDNRPGKGTAVIVSRYRI